MEHLEHKVRRIGTRGKGGAALITAIVFVFFLMLFGLAFYRLGETDIDLFDYDENLAKALYASEAGIDKVRWMLRESHKIPDANPFTSTYNEENALSIANPTEGYFFPGEVDEPYFKVTEITAELLPTSLPGSRVKVQAFGSVDADADGQDGLPPIGGGKFDPDPDDVTRRFEAYIGLPGTLGERIGEEGISAAAGAFYVGVAEVSLSLESRQFVTPDGDRIKDRNGDDGFRYFGSGTLGNWARWGFIFSDPAPTVSSGEIDEVELPPGIFDEIGDYIDDDNNGIPDYFQDLDLRTYGGNQTFTSSSSSDPTAGVDGRTVIYVNGDVVIDSVDFGHVGDGGDVKNCDWEKQDLGFIANGKITVNRVDCGNVGRLALVAKDIELVGNYDTKINGIAIAFNDITLDGSGCTNGILTRPPPDDDRPVKYAAYFLGSIVAGNHIVLKDDGWTVIYDENVINGNMYSAAVDSVPKPTLTYERMEAEDFNTDNNWEREGNELVCRQENYTDEDINNAQGDYTDGGTDEQPELMKVYHDQSGIWRRPAEPDDFAVSDGIYCDFTNAANVFADSDITVGPQNWDYYTTIHFWMTLDNWEKMFGSKTTLRKSNFKVLLYDTADNTLTFSLSSDLNPIYPNNDWVAAPGKLRWKLIRINPHRTNLFSDSDFDIRNVRRLEFYHDDTLVSWYKNDFDMEHIRYDKDLARQHTDYGSDGHYYYMTSEGTRHRILFEDPDGSGRRKLYYEDPPSDPPGSGTPWDIQWNWDPSTSTLEPMYFEDTVNPEKSALNTVLRIDRIEVPGKPATNDYLKYGLPHCLRLEITNWREF